LKDFRDFFAFDTFLDLLARFATNAPTRHNNGKLHVITSMIWWEVEINLSQRAQIIRHVADCLVTLASLKSPRLWPRCNNAFVSTPKPLILIYINPAVHLALRAGAGRFINNQFSNPASRSARMPAAFSMAVGPIETNRNDPSAGEH
jgi:hypothetical protein